MILFASPTASYETRTVMIDALPARAALREVRALMDRDPALERRLAAIAAPADFARRLAGEAAAYGIALPPEAAAALTEADALSLARFTPRPPDGTAWPSKRWLPAQTILTGPEPVIDWLNAGDERLLAPFFSDTIRRLQHRPFNRAFRYRMRLADFVAA